VRLADITFTPDGKEVLSFGRDRVSRLWDAATGKELFHFNLSERGQWALTPDKRTIVTTAYGREVRVWETSTGHKPRSAPWCISQFL
jgi:WD40 repeat protein